MLSLGSISIAELTESRLHIQDLVVRLACERATRADLDALEANIDETERVTAAGRYLERVECSREFYRLLVACAHNQVLAMMVRSVTEILMQFVYGRVAAGGKPQPQAGGEAPRLPGGAQGARRRAGDAPDAHPPRLGAPPARALRRRVDESAPGPGRRLTAPPPLRRVVARSPFAQRCARRPPGARFLDHAGRPVLRAPLRRHGRRRPEDRAARRRRHAPARAAARRPERLLRPAQRRQAQPGARPEAARGDRPGAPPGRRGRRADRELPSRRDGAAGPRPGSDARAQSEARLLLDLGLRPDRPGGRARRLRDDRPRRQRLRPHAGALCRRIRPAGAGRGLRRRRARRDLRVRRDPDGAGAARPHRPRPACRRGPDGLHAQPPRLRAAGGAVPGGDARARPTGRCAPPTATCWSCRSPRATSPRSAR